MKEPTLPIIAETNDDGTKRLFKTRYNELEKLYLSTHRTLRNTKAENQELIKALGDNEVQIHKLLKQVRELESKVVDSEAVEKTIKRLAKEAQIELPTHPFAAFPLQDQIQAFFGSILCRLRLEEIPDELAE